MALTNLTYPQIFEPVYSPFWFRFSSTTSNQPNMRYVFDTYHTELSSSTSTFIHRTKLFPREDATGQFSPSRILESYVSYNFDNFFSMEWEPAMNCVTGYLMKFGEEYDLTGSTWSFTSITNANGYTMYNFPTIVTGSTLLMIGDEIKVDKTNKARNSEYDGLQTITNFSGGGKSIITDQTFGTYYDEESGQFNYRLTIDEAQNLDGKVLNFARQFDERELNISTTYIQGAGTGKPLTNHLKAQTGTTNVNQNYRSIYVRPDDYYQVSYLVEPSIQPSYMLVFTYYSDGTSKGLYAISNTHSAQTYVSRLDFCCGPANLAVTNARNILTATFENIYTTGVKFITLVPYTVSESSGPYVLGEAITLEVNEHCNEHNPSVTLAFLNRLGGIDSFYFNRKQVRKIKIEREKYTKYLNWNYGMEDRGETTLNVNYNEEIVANTDWLTIHQGIVMEELFTSPEVFLVDADNQQMLPVVILSEEYITKTIKNDKYIQYTIKFRYAYKNNLQRN